MTALVMALAQRPDGADVARCGEHVAISRHGTTMALARVLVAAGVPDGPWQAERNGVPVMRGPSLHGLARLTCMERADGKRGFVAFRAGADGAEDALPLSGGACPAPSSVPAGMVAPAEAPAALAGVPETVPAA